MKKKTSKIWSILLALMMVTSLFAGMTVPVSAAESWDGAADSGWYNSTDTEFTLSDAGELAGLAQLVNEGNNFEGKTITLSDDIYLNSDAEPTVNSWTPIARYDTSENAVQQPFKGTFDGDGHYVYNLYISDASGSSATSEANALFGCNDGTIQNVGVTGSVASYRKGAGLVGQNFADGVITDSYSYVKVSANGGGSDRGSGGIAGTNYGTISNCINRGDVYNGYRRAGGIAGYNLGGTIENCYNVGAISSASSGYAGSITASHSNNDSAIAAISNCYYLNGSSAEGGVPTSGVSSGASAPETTVFNTDALLDNGDTLLDSIDGTGSHFIEPASGKYPVLFWQTGFVWDLCTVSVAPATGGTFKASTDEGEITDSVEVGAGSIITLEASAPDSGYLFTGFTADGENIGGTAKNPPYTLTYPAQSDVTLSASYMPTSETALSVYSQVGENGKKTLAKEYSWDDLLSMKQTSSGFGYMYTHGTTWDVVSATEYVTIDALLSDAGVTPSDTDQIVAAASDGSPKVIPTYKLLKEKLNFYPGAYYRSETEYGQPTENAVEVPAAIALSWNGASVSTGAGITAADALTEASAKAYNSGSLRFVYGCTEADYLSKAAMTTVQGNRLWSGVVSLTVRTPIEPYDAATDGTIIAAPMTDADNPGSDVCTDYKVESEDANVTISGIDLKSYVNDSDSTSSDKGYWIGISIPVPAEANDSDILIGTNLSPVGTADPGLIYSEGGQKYVKVYWDSVKDDITNAYVSFDGGNTIKEINIDDSGVSQSVLDFDGIQLSMAQLKAYPTTATYKMNGKGDPVEYTVTGIKISDILKNYDSEKTPASVTFTDTDTDFSNTANNSDYSWDDAMIAWSVKDASGKETITGALRSAVNGSAGKLWINGLDTVTLEDAELLIDGTGVTKDQLQKMTTSSAVFTSKGNPYTVEGVKISDLIGTLIKTNPASVTFASASGDLVSTANSVDYSWDDVMIIWSQKDAEGTETLTSGFKSAVNGASGKLWVGNLAKVTTEAAGLVADGKYLSLEQLKKFPTTSSYTQLSGSDVKTEYTVTGITFQDIFDNYLGGITPSAITLTAADGMSKVLDNSAAQWDQGMVIWSKVDSNNAQLISSGLASAVNNSYGRYWLNDLTEIKTEASDFIFDGKYMSVAQLKADAEAKQDVTYSWYKILSDGSRNDGTSVVSGLTIESLLKNHIKTSPSALSFIANDGSELTVTEGAFGWDKTMLAWKTDGSDNNPINVAVDGSIKKLWRSGIAEIKSLYELTFNVTPSNAKVTLKDSEGNTVEPSSDKSFLLPGGNTYSYTVSATGYTTKTDSIEVADKTTVDVTLNSTGGSGSGSGSGGGRDDNEDVIFTLYTQEGSTGTPVAVKTYSKSELYGLATTNKSGECYMYYKGDAWEGIVATVYVKLEDLLGDAGVNFASGDSLIEKAGTDGYSSSWTYDDIKDNCYFFDPANGGQKSVVPSAIALEWDGGSIENGYADVASKAYYSGSLRFVFGTTESLYTGVGTDWNKDGVDDKAQGNRLGNQISEVIIAKNVSLHDSNKFNGGSSNTGNDVNTTGGGITTTPGAQQFKDVAPTDWFNEAVEYVVSNGLFKGVSDNEFAPGSDMTRAMLVTVLHRYEGTPASTSIPSYKDVKQGEWYSEALSWADSNGIILGYSKDLFGVDDRITREQMAMILYRYASYKGYDVTASADLSAYSDVSSISSVAVTAMKWANAENFIQGVTNTTLDPKGGATRAQVATIIMRFSQKYKK